MNADTVYQVAKALPKEEQKRLLDKLKDDFKPKPLNRRKQKILMTKEDAREYLLKNVFGKKRKP